MRLPTGIYRLIWTLLLGAVSLVASAESFRDIGAYVVHYNALPTSLLGTEVARAYGITRSKTRGMLNVAVIKKRPGTTGTPVSATVRAHSTNLSSQLSELDMREIREQNAIYYIGEFNVRNEETLTFTINVSPEKSGPPQTITFTRQFFVD